MHPNLSAYILRFAIHSFRRSQRKMSRRHGSRVHILVQYCPMDDPEGRDDNEEEGGQSENVYVRRYERISGRF